MPNLDMVGSNVIKYDIPKSRSVQVVWMSRLVHHAGTIYHIFDGSTTQSVWSIAILVVLSISILLAFVTFIISTVPAYREAPANCIQPVCDNDPRICPGETVCEPQSLSKFDGIELLCLYVFTIDYSVKFLTSYAVSSREAHILPWQWDHHHDITDDIPVYSVGEHYIRYIFSVPNLIDLASFLPFYLMQVSHPKTLFVRVLRLVRVFKTIGLVVRFKRARNLLVLLYSTMKAAGPALLVMLLFNIIGVVFFGAIIYAVECGTFTVDILHPKGAYLRPTISGIGTEVSPFNSIPSGIYWAVTTGTTVGYGDLAPTSWKGRAIACVAMYCGIIVLALPVGVVSSNFSDLYQTLCEVEAAENSDIFIQQSSLPQFRFIKKLRAAVAELRQSRIEDAGDVVVSSKSSGKGDSASHPSSKSSGKGGDTSHPSTDFPFGQSLNIDKKFHDSAEFSISRMEVEAEFKAQRRAEQLIETLRAHADTAGVDLQQPQPDSDSLWSGKLIRMTSAKIVQSKQMQLALSNMNLVDNGNNSNTVSIDCSQLRVGEDMVESHQTGFKKSMSEPWSGSSMASAKYLLREPSQIEDHNLLSQYKYSVELNDDNDGEDDVELSQVWNEKIVQICAFIYLIVDGSLRSKKSIIAKVFNIFSNVVILVAIVAFISGTVPYYQYTPATCVQPACHNDPILCPGASICAPVPSQGFYGVDVACLYLFTIEFLVRLFTVWAVDARQAMILPWGWDALHDCSEPPPKYGLVEHYLRFLFAFRNTVDLLTIAPFFATGGRNTSSSFLRILRLFRIFKLLNKLPGIKDMLILVGATMSKSVPALGVMVLFSILGVIFFGSLIYTVEIGTFTATEQYPDGVYLRTAANGVDKELSPFTSIPVGMYWSVTTATTVGYGDLVPTSVEGRAIANILMYLGVMILALPIGVISSNFTELYHHYLASKNAAEGEDDELFNWGGSDGKSDD